VHLPRTIILPILKMSSRLLLELNWLLSTLHLQLRDTSILNTTLTTGSRWYSVLRFNFQRLAWVVYELTRLSCDRTLERILFSCPTLDITDFPSFRCKNEPVLTTLQSWRKLVYLLLRATSCIVRKLLCKLFTSLAISGLVRLHWRWTRA